MIGRTSTLPSIAAAAAVLSVLGGAPAYADGGDEGPAVLSLINTTRAANGCRPVTANSQLTMAAARHANDVMDSPAVGHVGSDGSSLAQRVTDAGYAPYATLGEVVFRGTGSSGNPAAAVKWWMSSPGHRAVITDCRFTEAGFSAVSDGGKMTVAGDFGTK